MVLPETLGLKEIDEVGFDGVMIDIPAKLELTIDQTPVSFTCGAFADKLEITVGQKNVSLPAFAMVKGSTVTAMESSANNPSLHFKLTRNLYNPASYPLTLVTRLLGELIKTDGPEI